MELEQQNAYSHGRPIKYSPIAGRRGKSYHDDEGPADNISNAAAIVHESAKI